MAIVKCAECERGISSRASVCPQCGCPRQAIKRNVSKAIVATGICLTVGAAILVFLAALNPRFDRDVAFAAERVLLGGAFLWIIGWWNRD